VDGEEVFNTMTSSVPHMLTRVDAYTVHDVIYFKLIYGFSVDGRYNLKSLRVDS